MTAIRDIARCRICNTPMRRVFDLGHHPLADRFLTRAQLDEPETYYPLTLGLCADCKYIGLMQTVPPTERYQSGEYSYTAGNSKVSREHFAELAQRCRHYLPRLSSPSDTLVVDIGGNDGTFLKAIHGLTGCRVWNIEPSSAGILAKSAGIRTSVRFWDADMVSWIKAEGGADLIVCTNVLNHIDDLTMFMHKVSLALKPGGYFVCEVPSFRDLERQNAWDTIYAEHVSYFSFTSLLRLFNDTHQLAFVGGHPVDYMGGSLRCFVQKYGDKISDKSDNFETWQKYASNAVVQRTDAGDEAGLFDTEVWMHLMINAETRRAELRRKLDAVKTLGGKAIGIGAAAKGNTFLSYCGITHRDLACIADASPHKIGKFTPGTHIPIVGDDEIPADATHAIILPWNLSAMLREKLGGRFKIIEV